MFDRITDAPLALEEVLADTRPLFPPVVCGIGAAVRSGRWRIIGHAAVDGFVYPRFLEGIEGEDGRIRNWYLWDGEEEVRLGPGPLPLCYWGLELLAIWPAEHVEERIETGTTDLLTMLREANPELRPRPDARP